MNDTTPTDSKDYARKAADGVKDLTESLKKHDFKAELREAFAEAKKNPASIWKKPETLRPGKDIAIAGLAAAIVGLFLLLVTSGAFIGVVCLVIGICALLLGALGLKTEGRTLAFAGVGAGVLAVLMSIGQIHSATRKPDPRDELIRLLSAQLAQSQGKDAVELAKIQAQLEALKVEKTGKANGGGDSFEATRARVAADPSLTVRALNLPGLAPRSPTGELLPQSADSTKNDSSVASRPSAKIPNAFGEESEGRTGGKKDKFGHEFRTQDEDPPAGPSSDRNKEVRKVLEKEKIETMTIDLPDKVQLLLSKLPDGSFMGTFEVTQDQWLAIMGGENPSGEDNVGDDHPVDSVWPADCLAFVEKLNALPDVKKAGLQFRIPSEEEWETACLAGNKKSRDFGLRLDGEKVTKKSFGEIAWCMDNFTRPANFDPDVGSGGISHSVGRKQPNAYGLYDMHGNVAELVFAKPSPASSTRFVSKGGYWQDNSDKCEAYKDDDILQEPPKNYSGARQPTNHSLGLRVAASVLDKDIARILAAGEKAAENDGVAFFGFYPGMSEEDAARLAKHYGLATGDNLVDKADNQGSKPGRCQLEVNPVTKKVVQIQFDLPAILALTKEAYGRTDKFDKFLSIMSKHAGNLNCIRDGRNPRAPNVPPENYLYQRTSSDGLAISLKDSGNKNPILTLEDVAEMASQAAAQMAAVNNARIEAVEPVLREAGIKTKTIELPGGAKLLLTELPDGRFMGTFEVTQAQFVSVMGGENPSKCVGADFPVDSVSVQDCLDFIEKANELPAVKEGGLRFQLPSLVDWEIACRAGTEGDYTRRLDDTDVDKNTLSDMMEPPLDVAGKKSVQRGPHPVGVAKPNAFGLYDMFGNVSEWVADKRTPGVGRQMQYYMGGAWNSNEIKPIRADEKTNYYRNYYGSDSPENTSPSIGFRVSVVSTGLELQRAKEEAARAYALSNNGRIDTVKPVLEKAGIKTKEIELPGGFRLLLNKLPDGSWAAAFETTQAQWKSLLHDNPSSFGGDPVCTDEGILAIWRSWKDENPEKLRGTGLPVDQMSPGDIQTFLVLLNALPAVREAGLTFHLPTQDEWLYISRAGAKSKYAKPLDGGDSSVDALGWHAGNIEGAKRLQVVGQKQPNAFGLYDVHGNAAEFAECLHGGGHGKKGFYAMGGSVGAKETKECALARPIAGFGEKLDEFRGVIPPFTGFRLVATEGGLRHLVDPEMAAASNARIDAVKPTLDAKGVETKILDLPGGVKLLLSKLPNGPWLGAFEVTQAQFLSILGENPSIVGDPRRLDVMSQHPWQYRTGDRPVDNVRIASAAAFLRTLSALPCAKEAGLSFRLPTCAEWVRFCGAKFHEVTAEQLNVSNEEEFKALQARRGWDFRYDSYSFPLGKTLQDIAWIEENVPKVDVRGTGWQELATGSKVMEKIALSQPVGGKDPFPMGIYDMFGNVSEWTSTLAEAAHERQSGGARDYFYMTGTSFHELNRAMISKEGAGGNGEVLTAVGFRVWGWPAASQPAQGKTAPSTNSLAVAFIQDSNARIDAVKPVLKDAGIEMKEIELPGGARILMNKLPNGAWMGAFEVTQAQFVSIFGTNRSRIKGGDRAVDNVSWNVARVYAATLNELPSVKASGLHFRLPSSTEWETACRAGGGVVGAPLGKPLEPGKGKLADMGWYDQNSDIEGVKQTHRVGFKQPNAFGLYDMIGNVAEWTATSYTHEGVVGANETGSRKIWRGGSWISPKEWCTAGWRGLLKSDAVRPDMGFRLYATEDGSDIKEETVTFRDKDFHEAAKPGPLPDDRTDAEKLLGAIIEFGKEMEKLEMQLQLEEVKFELELLGIDSTFLR